MISFSLSTSQQTEFLDITREVEKITLKAQVSEGLALVYCPHTTAGITINEGADPSVQEDILKILNQIVPSKGPYRHGEGNSPAHIKASLIGSSVSVVIENGRLLLGRWQSLFFCEFDGPRTRQVFIKIIAQ
ncbi:MAG: YjbQ family protein [Deltaproteobacteria bacterium]|nr:YjbQ family protein [Deltaproteobacteria bacterium]